MVSTRYLSFKRTSIGVLLNALTDFKSSKVKIPPFTKNKKFINLIKLLTDRKHFYYIPLFLTSSTIFSLNSPS